jgi:dTDP-glucose 4,6-dehydratase
LISVRGEVAVVAGGAGFLGSHLSERLLDEGIRVLCVDNLITGRLANIAGLVGRDGFELVEADVTRHIRIPGRVDFVVNLASPASPTDYLQLPIETLKVGSIGTLNTLGLARAKNARYLLASTSEVYGDPKVHPQPETYWGHVNPVGPRGVYDEAKRFGEALTVAYRETHRVDAAIMRIFNTYGPRMRTYDGRAIPTFVRQALTGRPLTIAGDGTQTRSIMYVDDLIDGAIRLLRSSSTGPVNIGSPDELRVIDIATLIRDLADSDSTFEFIDRPADDPSVRRPDISLATELLDWKPKVSVEDGLGRTVAWYRDHLTELEG